MVLHCALDVGPAIAQIILTDLKDCLEFLFGSTATWDTEAQFLDITGAQVRNTLNQDLLTAFVLEPLDPFMITKGIKQAFIPLDKHERVDKLLRSLESSQIICSNGTMLTCGLI